MAIKLMATDMDGTFLDKNSQYDKQRLCALLDRAKEAGVLFAAASGRSLPSLKREFEGFENDMIFLGENGSAVEFQGHILFERFMPKELYLEITQKIRDSHFKNSNTVHLSGKKAAYILPGITDEYRAFLEHYFPLMITVEDFSQVEDDIYKVGANFDHEELFEASQWLTKTIDGVVAQTSGFECLDVMLASINKGYAMKEMCKALEISLDQVVAFGDNFNDVEMLKVVGRAVVPENAHPEIQSLADEVIGHHDTGSVLTYMEEMLCLSN